MIRWWRKFICRRPNEPDRHRFGFTPCRPDSAWLDRLCTLRKYHSVVAELVIMRKALPHFRLIIAPSKHPTPEFLRPQQKFAIHIFVDLLESYLTISEEIPPSAHTPFTQPLRNEIEFFLAVHRAYPEEGNLKITLDRILLISELELLAITRTDGSTAG